MDWVGKKVKVIFDDGVKINSKIGILQNQFGEFVFLKLNNNEEAISVKKIIRMELIE